MEAAIVKVRGREHSTVKSGTSSDGGGGGGEGRGLPGVQSKQLS